METHPSKCLKYVLVIVNVIFLLLGLALLGLAVYLFVDKTVVIAAIKLTQPVLIAAIVIGGLIALISLLGCCGAAAENSCALCTYGTFISVLIVAEIAIAIVFFVIPTIVNGYVRCQWYPACGGCNSTYCSDANYCSWGCFSILDFLNTNLPDWSTVIGCNTDPSFENCLTHLETYLRDKLIIVGSVAAAFAVIELLGVIGSCILRSQINKYKLEKGPDDDMYR